jgi:eukaryotic-like serine/threonine-protein kinase
MPDLLVFSNHSSASSRSLECPSEEMVQELLGGRLPLSQAAVLHQHLEGCAACSALLAALGRAQPASTDEGLPFVDPENYYVDGQLARGGLGRILKARDQRLGRVVAIKQLLDDDHEGAARFHREALVTARLQHPAIIPVYEAGRWPSGDPFYAMKLVAGRSLGDVLAGARTLDARLALLPNVIAVTDAIAYAHGQGVIHRDLKPANILVGEFGETVVIDWGLAKLVTEVPPAEAPVAESGGELSLAGSVLGTPAYMPPEQARGNPVDSRADVYALGAVLYHLLVGSAPYRGRTSREILDRVLGAAPPPVEEGAPGAPAELVAIVERAMARDAAARYPSAAELAEDLRRFVTGQLVRAHRYTRGQLVRRWLKRHQLLAVTLSVLLGSGAIGVWRILGERDRAETARAVAEAGQIDLLLLQAKSALEHDPTAALGWLDRYLEAGGPPGQAWPLAADLVGRGVAAAVVREKERETTVALSPDGGTLALPGLAGRVRLLSVDRGAWSSLSSSSLESARELKFSPDGHKLLAAREKVADVFSLDDGGGSILLDGVEHMWRWVFSPDGRRLMGNGGFSEDQLAMFDLTTATRHSLQSLGERGWTIDPFFGADGHARGLDTEGDSIVVQDFDSGTRKTLRSTAGWEHRAELSHDGSSVLLQEEGGGLRLWDLASGRLQALPSASASTEMALSADGRVAAWITPDNFVRWWDGRSSDENALTVPGAAQHLEFAPRGRTLAVTSGDDAIHLFEGASLERSLLGHHGPVGLAFAEDARTVVSWEIDGRQLRVWHIADLPSTVLRAAEGVRAMAFSPDGSAVALSGLGHTRLYELPYGEAHALPSADTTSALAWSPDGSSLAVAAGGVVHLCKRKGECRALPGATRAGAIGFSKDGRTLAAAGEGGVRLWSLGDGALRILSDEALEAWQLELSEDGSKLAVAGLDRRVRLWDLASGKPTVLEGHAVSVSRVRFSRDGKTLATGSADGTVRLWDLARGTARTLERVEGTVNEVALSPDGKKIAFADASHLVKLWEPASDRLLLFEGHDGEIRDLCFSPDGTLVASASADHTARVWDAVHGHAAQVLRGHTVPVQRVLFAADGRSLWSGSDDGTLRRWPLSPALGPNRALAGWLRSLSTARIDADGTPFTP